MQNLGRLLEKWQRASSIALHGKLIREFGGRERNSRKRKGIRERK